MKINSRDSKIVTLTVELTEAEATNFANAAQSIAQTYGLSIPDANEATSALFEAMATGAIPRGLEYILKLRVGAMMGDTSEGATKRNKKFLATLENMGLTLMRTSDLAALTAPKITTVEDKPTRVVREAPVEADEPDDEEDEDEDDSDDQPAPAPVKTPEVTVKGKPQAPAVNPKVRQVGKPNNK